MFTHLYHLPNVGVIRHFTKSGGYWTILLIYDHIGGLSVYMGPKLSSQLLTANY